MSITKAPFAKTALGREVYQYTITSGNYSAQILDYGATIRSLFCPDKNGNQTDIMLGFDDITPYETGCGYIGATVGRFANRIERGKFTLNGKEYSLYINNGPNHLHGGKEGFSSKIFKADIIDDTTLQMQYTSPDGEEGYPGTLDLTVTFTLSAGGELNIKYRAESDADTVVNFTNHSYFNLNGANSGKGIENHYITIPAKSFCENDTDCLPTGKIIKTENTPMNLTTPALLENRLGDPYKAISDFGGYDNCFILHEEGVNHPLGVAAVLYSPDSGIELTCGTTLPAIQLYTGNCIENDVKAKGKYGVTYKNHYALCLETQNFPNATSHAHFPSPVLKKGEVYLSETYYKMSTK